MRLLRLKPYRAVPELDGFSDQQCSQFMVAARASWRGKLVRCAIVAISLFAITVVVSIVAVATWRSLGSRPLTSSGDFAFQVITSSILGFAIGMLGGLLVNDLLLRRDIRRLIRECGSCPECRYTLVGMPVSDERCLQCPECGRRVDTDESMGDIAVNARGERAYLPQVARVDSTSAQRRRRRHRVFVAWSTGAFALLFIVAGVMYGSFYWSLRQQAARAKSDRRTAVDIEAARAKMWPNGRESGSESEWEKFESTISAFMKLEVQLQTEYAEAGQNFPARTFDFTALDASMTEASFKKSRWDRTLASASADARRYLQRARDDGLFARLVELRDLKSPMRTLGFDEPNQMFFTATLSGAGETRFVGHVCLGRMHVAMQAGDLDEYANAVEDAMTVSNIYSRQGLMIELLNGLAVEKLVYDLLQEHMPAFPDRMWHERLLAVARRHADRVTLIDAHRCERISVRDALQVFHSDPWVIQRVMLGMDWYQTVPVGRPFSGRVGGYEENMRRVDAHFDGWIANRQSNTAIVPPTTTGSVIVDAFTPWSTNAAATEMKTVAVRRRVVLALSCATYESRHARWPGDIEELVPLLPDRTYLIDPLVRRPFTLAPEKGRPTVVDPAAIIRDGVFSEKDASESATEPTAP